MTAEAAESGLTRVLVIAPGYPPAFRGGGPIQTLHALVTQAPSKYDIRVLTSNQDLGDPSPLTDHPDRWIGDGRVKVRYSGRSLIKQARGLFSTMSGKPRIVYLNSFFSLRHSILEQLLHKVGCWPRSVLLVAPRGELHPNALTFKRNKKSLYLRIYRLLRLHRDVVWHASNETEADFIRQALASEVEVVVRPNESPLPRHATQRDGRVSGVCRIAFVSRAVPKKGLHKLLGALRGVTGATQLKVVGAFESLAYERQCRALAKDLPANVNVEFFGPAPRAEVLRLLEASDLLALPTEAENFGQVIAESLSRSCPVMCSSQTPWTALLSTGGGVVVEPNSEAAWENALNRFVSQEPVVWRALSERAGNAYDDWQNRPKEEHVFEMASPRVVPDRVGARAGLRGA